MTIFFIEVIEMKKFISNFFLLFVGLAVILSGCSLNTTKKKPTLSYYTDSLKASLETEPCKAKEIQLNLTKEKTLSEDDLTTVRSFFKSLKKSDYIYKPDDLPSKPSYKLFFTFDKSKYVIDVYNEKYITIYPWDGDLPMDYIEMTNIPVSQNIYELCKYEIQD